MIYESGHVSQQQKLIAPSFIKRAHFEKGPFLVCMYETYLREPNTPVLGLFMETAALAPQRSCSLKK